MSTSASKSAVVLGNGFTGSITALSLASLGWKPQIVTLGPGATNLSSGAWDFGKAAIDTNPATNSLSTSLSDFFSAHTTRLLKDLFIEWQSLPTEQSLLTAIQSIRTSLMPELELTLSTDRPLLLPSTQGSLREVYLAQKVQADCNLRNEPRRIGVVYDPQWSFPAQRLCDRWNLLSSTKKLSAVFVPLQIVFSKELQEIETIAITLEKSDAARSQFIDCLRPLKSECDLLLLPPFSLSSKLQSEIQQTINIPMAEPLCSRETVAGRRLQIALEAALGRAGISTQTVEHCRFAWKAGAAQGLDFLNAFKKSEHLSAAQYVLCSGRFLSRGFSSESGRWEVSATGVPISILKGSTWTESFAPRSNYSRMGVSVDDAFRARMFSGGFAANVRATGSCIGGVDYAETQLGLGVMALLGSECARKMAEV